MLRKFDTNRAAVTISTVQTFARAKLLAATFKSNCLNGRFYCLLLSQVPSEDTSSDKNIQLISSNDMAAFVPHFWSLLFAYSEAEIRKILLPFVLDYVHTQTKEYTVVYIDTSLNLVGTLDKRYHGLSRHCLALVPRINSFLHG